MKNIIKTAIATAAAFLVLAPAIASAAPVVPVYTDVSGTVYNNGKTVNNAKVIVICNNHDIKTTTDGSGSYAVAFLASKCPVGTSVTVTATKGGKGGESSGTVNKYEDHLNVTIVNVNLPEFGLIAGIAAATIGTGAFLVIRRRQLGANQA